MIFLPQPKVLLFALLLTLLGGAVGLSNFYTSVPATGMFTESTRTIPSLDTSVEAFIDSVVNGNKDQVVGVYIDDVLALPVGQQPRNDAGFVTRRAGEITQFNMAEQYGTIGLLAHNDLAGAEFSDIPMDQSVAVIYGDGRLEYYTTKSVEKYQALSPTNTFSEFINLDGSNARITAGDLFSHVYGTGDRLVFQTCIEANGNGSWGRMFIIAEPAPKKTQPQISKPFTLFQQLTGFGLAGQN